MRDEKGATDMSVGVKDLSDEIAARLLVDPSAESEAGWFMLNGKRLPLAAMTERDLASRVAAESFSFLAAAPHWIAGKPDLVAASPSIDHRGLQSPVKNQFDRLTCASFATLAAMEALLKADGKAASLSEQHAVFVTTGKICDDATEITDMAAALETKRICVEDFFPYEDQTAVAVDCQKPVPAAATLHAKYAIGSHQEIPNLGVSGPGIANPGYLETLLSHGHDIVAEIEAVFSTNGTGIQDVLIDPLTGGPARTGRKHALLIVGYDRRGPKPFFLCKNSYGTSAGIGGYFQFSYRYMSTYAIRGVLVGSVQVH
jgi:Papain family cysteine protease